MRKFGLVLAALLLLLTAYLTLWPVAVEPVSWRAPIDVGYTGIYEPNARLQQLKLIDLDGRIGPEDADIGQDGLIYAATHDGEIIRVETDGSVTGFAQTGGRPLGIEFDENGTLFVADAYRGLLSIDPSGAVTQLADQTVDGSPILYADDVDIAADGIVYFSDASTRFGAEASGGTLQGSLLDLMEHSANGRILKYDPGKGEASVFADGLTFANGVAVSDDQQWLLFVETGEYRVWRYPLDGGAGEVVLENLPGFPDNVNPVGDGTFWLGLVSPRNALMDRLSDAPFWRRAIMRLPDAMRPAPTRYGFVLRFDVDGNVIETLQDPDGAYALTTGAVTMPDGRVVVTSLTEPSLGVMERP
ncbi:MAG: SMP-30/gluconolactonase/LRE family protein [Pseudomonadota bacterium]